MNDVSEREEQRRATGRLAKAAAALRRIDEHSRTVAAAKALRTVDATRAVDVDGYHPQLRAGVHVGKPRRLGGDYLGVDVNVAARVAQAAGGDELLVSEAACRRLDHEAYHISRARRFKGKG